MWKKKLGDHFIGGKQNNDDFTFTFFKCDFTIQVKKIQHTFEGIPRTHCRCIMRVWFMIEKDILPNKAVIAIYAITLVV